MLGDNATPLFLAAQHGHEGVVSTLLQANANPDASLAGSALTPAYVSAQERHFGVLRLLASTLIRTVRPFSMVCMRSIYRPGIPCLNRQRLLAGQPQILAWV